MQESKHNLRSVKASRLSSRYVTVKKLEVYNLKINFNTLIISSSLIVSKHFNTWNRL